MWANLRFLPLKVKNTSQKPLNKIVTLTTDYGEQDGFVGAVKGVLLSFCPEAQLVDITHQISAFSIEEAAFVFQSGAPFFPKGTIHLVVVDPGVGGERRPIAVRTTRGIYVGPDNGVFSGVYASERNTDVFHLNHRQFFLKKVSATFHGRDLFAPVVGHLLQGVPLEKMGTLIRDYVRFPISRIKRRGRGLEGRIIHIDHFGNAITNITEENLRQLGSSRRISIRVRKLKIHGVSKTFGSVKKGEPVALIGGSGLLEIAIREGNAAQEIGARLGNPVNVETTAVQKRPRSTV
jgi:S-adenosylmethionine hydrolase